MCHGQRLLAPQLCSRQVAHTQAASRESIKFRGEAGQKDNKGRLEAPPKSSDSTNTKPKRERGFLLTATMPVQAGGCEEDAGFRQAEQKALLAA